MVDKRIRKIFAIAAASLLMGCSSLLARQGRESHPGDVDGFGPVFGMQGMFGIDHIGTGVYKERLHGAGKLDVVQMASPENKEEMQFYLRQFDDLKDADLLTKLAEVDRRVDQYLAYATDQENYGTFEYWAPPLIAIRKAQGDCEDFAILKHRVLRYLGVPDTDMRMILLGDLGDKSEGHAVLMVWTSRGKFVLDNQDRDLKTGAAIDQDIYNKQCGYQVLEGVHKFVPQP